MPSKPLAPTILPHTAKIHRVIHPIDSIFDTLFLPPNFDVLKLVFEDVPVYVGEAVPGRVVYV